MSSTTGRPVTATKRLCIILPSYNDARIERAIRSIRNFDDIGVVRIVVIDGGSHDDIRELIRGCLSSDDIFISEPDEGIFDAMNKGLDACDTEYVGYLGSDDMFTGAVASSQVVAALREHDLVVANVAFFRDGYVTRITHALPSRLGLMKLGLHNPHFATFGRAALLKSERFRLDLRGSDIDYFVRVFEKRPQVATLNVVATLQEEGGFSNGSSFAILRTNLELISMYSSYTNWILGPVAVAVKLSYKSLSKAYYRIFRVPVAAR